MSTRRCSYCNKNVGKGYSFISRKFHPTTYKCKRNWCKVFRNLGLLRKKKPVQEKE